MAPNEGIGCVDDVSRAIILALELYKYFGDTNAKEYALNLLKFIEYMMNSDGEISNFISNTDGKIVTSTPSSYYGGAYWSSRAMWSLAKAYAVTKNTKYLDIYRKIKFEENYQNDVSAILLIAEIELGNEMNVDLVKKYSNRIADSIKNGYFTHKKNELTTHMWGYHELEAIAKASQVLKNEKLLADCISTIKILVKDAVEKMYFYSFPNETKARLCVYCISPFVRGLYEIYLITKDSYHLQLLNQSIDWLYGENSLNKTVYDKKTGICFDGIENNIISKDAGAESSIEAGFCEVKRLLLQKMF